jgi:hypothetical protein
MRPLFCWQLQRSWAVEVHELHGRDVQSVCGKRVMSPMFCWQLQRFWAVDLHAMRRWKLPILARAKCLHAMCRWKLPTISRGKRLLSVPRWFVLPRRWVVRSLSVPTGLLLPARLLRPERVSCGQLLRKPRGSIPLSSKHVQRVPQADVAGAVQPLPPRPTIRLRILRVLCAVPSQPVQLRDLQLLQHSEQSACRVLVVLVAVFRGFLPVQDEGHLQEAQGQARGQGNTTHPQTHHLLPNCSRPGCKPAAPD